MRISGNLYLTKVQFVRRFMVAEWCATFFTDFGMVSLSMDGERPILHVSATISGL